MAVGGASMNLDDAKREWQAQLEPHEPIMSETEILDFVKRRSTSFDKQIMRRDRREVIAAVVVAVLFMPLLAAGPWLARAGVIVVLGALALIVARLGTARRADTTGRGDRSLSELLNTERAKIDGQIRLLESVLSWYIVPLAIGALMVDAGIAGVGWFTLVYTLLIVVLSVLIYRTNQRAVRSQLLPRREEVDRLIQQLKE